MKTSYGKVRETASNIKNIVGRNGLICLILSCVLGGILGGVELMVAGIIQVLFYKLGLVQSVDTSELFFDPSSISVEALSFGLIATAVIRGGGNFGSAQISRFASESISCRLRLQAFSDLVLQTNKYVSAGEVGFRVSDIIPKTVSFIGNLFGAIPFAAQSVPHVYGAQPG